MAARNSDCSVFIGNLDKRVTEELLWELLLQAGPIKSIHIPRDKETGDQKAFGFVDFSSNVSARYAGELLDGIKFFGRPLSVRPQQNDVDTCRNPTNQMSASNFYSYFYSNYDEQKRRPQSEPRRNPRDDGSYHHSSRRNNSFSHPLNRSFSSPANPTFYQPVRSWSPYTGLLNPGVNQTPPSQSSRYR